MEVPYNAVSDLIALDVAVLPPPEIRDRARAISADLAHGREGDGLVLDEAHLPHITLTQQYVRREELEPAFERIDDVLRGQPPLPLTVTGAGRSGHSAWMAIERTTALSDLHERLMEALRGFERAGGTPAAFYEGDARVGDVVWVTGYRLKSSFGAFTPHITLGAMPAEPRQAAGDPPHIEAMRFEATVVAACHLGRYCSCRAVLRGWTLSTGAA